MDPQMSVPATPHTTHQTTGTDEITEPRPSNNVMSVIRRHAKRKRRGEITFVYTDGHQKWA